MRKILLHCAAEIEARFWHYGHSLFWRRRELRTLGVRFGRVLSVRDHFHASGAIEFGERVALGPYVQISACSPVTIGDDFLSAGNLIINTGSHDLETLEPLSAPIRIGKRVWCGVHATILGGTEIGDDVVVAAGAVVRGHIPSGTLVGGVPARVLKTIDRSQMLCLWSWSVPKTRALRKNQA